MKKIIGLNTMPDGTVRTIKAQYQQSSRANFVRHDSLGSTGVMEIDDDETLYKLRQERWGENPQEMPNTVCRNDSWDYAESRDSGSIGDIR